MAPSPPAARSKSHSHGTSQANSSNPAPKSPKSHSRSTSRSPSTTPPDRTQPTSSTSASRMTTIRKPPNSKPAPSTSTDSLMARGYLLRKYARATRLCAHRRIRLAFAPMPDGIRRVFSIIPQISHNGMSPLLGNKCRFFGKAAVELPPCKHESLV